MPEETSLKEAKHRRRIRGVVVRSAMEKTVTVQVERLFRHPRVGRVVRSSRKFLVHDAQGRAHLGDTVLIEETRPRSRRKRWKVVDVLERAVVPGEQDEVIEETSRV